MSVPSLSQVSEPDKPSEGVQSQQEDPDQRVPEEPKAEVPAEPESGPSSETPTTEAAEPGTESEEEPAKGVDESIEDLFGPDLPSRGQSDSKDLQPEKPEGPQEPVLYISDTDNGRIVIMMGMEGDGYSSLGLPGYGLGRFLRPKQVWVDYAGRLHIADSGNNRVVRIDQATVENRPSWNEVDGLSDPHGVAVDGFGVYISDTKADRIVVYDELLDNAKVREEITHPQMRKPTSLWIDQHGALYICAGEDPPGGKLFKTWMEKERRRWSIYEGENLSGSRFLPTSVITTADGLVILDYSGQRVITMRDMTGNRLKEHRFRLDPRTRLRRPTGLGLSNDGRIFLTDSGNDRILEIDKNGQVKGAFVEYGGDPNTLLSNPTSVFIYSPAPPPVKKDDDDDEEE